jgi:hypothetical protein
MVNFCLMFKLCPIFPLPLYLVATGLRTIQFLFSVKNHFKKEKYYTRVTPEIRPNPHKKNTKKTPKVKRPSIFGEFLADFINSALRTLADFYIRSGRFGKNHLATLDETDVTTVQVCQSDCVLLGRDLHLGLGQTG